MLRIFWCFCVRLFQPFPLWDGSIYFGTAPWYFLSRYTSGFPEMGISLTPNGLIVFCHDLLTYSNRAAGESLVLQTWRMSEPFAPDPLGERIVSLPAEIQGEPLHIISLMTRLPENNFGPLALLNVYAAGTDMVTRVPVERFDIDLYYMADKHGALGMGLSYASHGAFCSENQVYHFDNVFFEIGEDEARLMSPSQRVLLETGYEALQRPGLIRASVGIAFQAEHSSIPSSTYQAFDEYTCHLWHHYS